MKMTSVMLTLGDAEIRPHVVADREGRSVFMTIEDPRSAVSVDIHSDKRDAETWERLSQVAAHIAKLVREK